MRAECIPQTLTCFSLSSQYPHSRESCGFGGMCVCVSQCVWEGLCPWENEFRWKQTSESVSRQRFKSLLSDNDDERCVDEGVDWYQTDGGELRDKVDKAGDKAGICMEKGNVRLITTVLWLTRHVKNKAKSDVLLCTWPTSTTLINTDS